VEKTTRIDHMSLGSPLMRTGREVRLSQFLVDVDLFEVKNSRRTRQDSS
jgi:hypothetical protein